MVAWSTRPSSLSAHRTNPERLFFPSVCQVFARQPVGQMTDKPCRSFSLLRSGGMLEKSPQVHTQTRRVAHNTDMNEPPPSPPTSGPSQGSSPIRVAIVEDNYDARELFRRSVERSPGLSCVGTFITGEQALHELPSLLPDLVLMDIHLPGINGIECMKRLRRTMPAVKVVVVTSERDDDYLFAALRAGADGYVTKPCDRATLARVITETMAGGRPIASDMTGHLVQAAMNPPKRRLQTHPSLSPRENEVMALVAQGKENKEIAERLNLSVTTVNTHLQSAYGKLGVQNRVEAVRILVGL